MKIYNYEGKNEEELILKALNELDVKDDELIYTSKEEVSGLLKKKKVILNVILKSDVIEFTKKYLKEIVNSMGLDLNIETKRKEIEAK